MDIIGLIKLIHFGFNAFLVNCPFSARFLAARGLALGVCESFFDVLGLIGVAPCGSKFSPGEVHRLVIIADVNLLIDRVTAVVLTGVLVKKPVFLRDISDRVYIRYLLLNLRNLVQLLWHHLLCDSINHRAALLIFSNPLARYTSDILLPRLLPAINQPSKLVRHSFVYHHSCLS